MSKNEEPKIFFLAPYPVGCAPSQRFKYEQYYSLFEQHGFSITTSSFVNLNFWQIIYKPGYLVQKIWYTMLGYARRIGDLFRLRSFDIVYIHLWVTPLGPPFFEWLVKLIARKVIYDLDDMIYIGHSSEANKLFMGIKGKTKTPYLIKHADHIIVTSDELFDYASRINPQTTSILSTVDTERFVGEVKKPGDGKLVIGWTGTHSTSKYLNILDNVLQRLTHEIEFTLLVIGDDNFKCDNINLVHKPWSVATEVQELQAIDIGLYPLPFEQWIMGKSGLKAMTYMSMEIPCVATAIGANNKVVVEGETGYLVKTDDEWYDKIKTLAENPEMRQEMGIRGRKVVEDKFSVKSNIGKYLDVFNSVINE